MPVERYEGTPGWDLLRKITGEHGERTMERHMSFSPSMCDMIVDYAYGQVYSRPALDLRQRMTVTLSTLIAMGGCEKELAVHVGSALNVGLSAAEIVEIALHAAPYVGFPRVMNAISVIREVFEKRGIETPEGGY